MEYKGYVITEIDGETYLIEGNGTRIRETSKAPFNFPHPSVSVMSSAQTHIDAMVANEESAQQEQVTIAQLQQQIADLQDALIELAGAVEGGGL